jgi:hypothetical protein
MRKMWGREDARAGAAKLGMIFQAGPAKRSLYQLTGRIGGYIEQI